MNPGGAAESLSRAVPQGSPAGAWCAHQLRRPWPLRRQTRTLALAASLAALGAGLLGGCASPPPPAPPAPTDRVILLPQPDGAPSAVELRQGDRQLRLDKPYAVADAGPGGLQPGQTDAQAVRQRYGTLLDGLPARPQRFVVRFERNGQALTPDGQLVIVALLQALKGYPAVEVIVTGHTDTVGNAEANDRLSKQRAETVRGLLVAAGVPNEAIQTVGRGEREPEVPTADNVDEPRNRRVEIRLR